MTVKLTCTSAIIQEDREDQFNPQSGVKQSVLLGTRTIAEFANYGGDVTVHLAIKGPLVEMFEPGGRYEAEVK